MCLSIETCQTRDILINWIIWIHGQYEKLSESIVESFPNMCIEEVFTSRGLHIIEVFH